MFDNIVGNEKVKKLLSNIVQNQKVTHSYLFTGPEGIGKKQIAIEFSKKLLKSQTENNPDFDCIEPEGNVIKINQIRDLQIKVQEKPIKCLRKVYIINDADKMTTEAQNCLLKTLEEPPEFVILILIGANENAFLSTIKSRCMSIHFESIKDEEMKQFLLEKYNLQVTETILQMFQGSISKAIELKEKIETYENIKLLIENMDKLDLIDIMEKAQILYQSKEEIQKMLEYINTILLELAITDNKYANCIPIVEKTKKD